MIKYNLNNLIYYIFMSKKINFPEVKSAIFKSLGKEKNIDILSYRFGLGGRRNETLEEIGSRFNVTRERIRQIQKSLIKKIGESPDILPVFRELTALIKKEGGVAKKSKIEKLTFAQSQEDSIILDILLLSCQSLREVNNKFIGKSWAVEDLDDQKINKIIECVSGVIEKEGKTLTKESIVDKVLVNCPFLGKKNILAVVNSSDLLGRDIDGRIGFKSWGVITPKNTRDKAYFVFRGIKKPLHYRKITELLSVGNFGKGKKVSVEAVHNELIRDSRFVLVGRGLYALSEWGYRPGTVADVIEEIFRKEGGALHKNEVVKRVLEKRFVKKNTILLNLQEKPQFVRVRRAVYKLKES